MVARQGFDPGVSEKPQEVMRDDSGDFSTKQSNNQPSARLPAHHRGWARLLVNRDGGAVRSYRLN